MNFSKIQLYPHCSSPSNSLRTLVLKLIQRKEERDSVYARKPDFWDHFQFNYIAGSCTLSIQETYVHFFTLYSVWHRKQKIGIMENKKRNRLFLISNYFFCSFNYKFTLNEYSIVFVVSFLFARTRLGENKYIYVCIDCVLLLFQKYSDLLICKFYASSTCKHSLSATFFTIEFCFFFIWLFSFFCVSVAFSFPLPLSHILLCSFDPIYFM